jgi:hypothetical protein
MDRTRNETARLAAAIKAGKNLDDFLIANANRSGKAKGRKAYPLPRPRDPLPAPVLGTQVVEAFHAGIEVEREPEPSKLTAAA